MYTMTVYVAARGTPINEKPNEPSAAGHMWFTLNSGQVDGFRSYGFAPLESKGPSLPVQGDIKRHDNEDYLSYAYSRRIEITEEQYNNLKAFGDAPDAYGFDKANYWLLNNSCVDFVWKALDIAGVNRTGYEGSLIPVANIEDLRKFVELSSLEIKRVDDFLKTAFPLSWDKDSLPGIDDQCNRYTTAALNWVPPRRDPLVLDLDGNGITTSGINPAAPILFDQDGDGIKNATGWIASGEAIVVRDLNGNGTIDSGREIFGDNTILTTGPKAGQTAANGFEALADLDSNNDGKFNASDAAFSSVKLWKDFNQNGRSDAGELFSFADLNVQSINIGATASNLDLGGGNTQTFTGSFTTAGGATGAAGTAQLAGSLLLSNNNFYREFTDDPALTTAAMSSPDMKGSGLVRDLRAAMSLGTTQSLTLQTQVTQFATDTRDNQLLHLNELIQSWGNTSGMPTSIQTSTTLANTAAGVGSITAVTKFSQTNPELYAKITALEQFNGQTIVDKWVRATSNGGNAVVYSPEQETLIGQAYNALKDGVYGALIMQTRFKPYLESIGLTVDSTEVKFDTAPLLAMLDAKKGVNEVGAFLDAAELDHYATSTMKATGAEVRQKLFEWLVALPVESPLWAVLKAPGIIRNFQFGSTFKESSIDDIFIGDAGANIIQGGAGNTKLFGGAGNDTLYGDAGDDVIVGGKGNDYYQNNYFGYAYGNDTYQFSKGDGIDTINDYDITVGNMDTVQFMDVASTELTGVYNSSNNLVITYGASDQVTIVNYFSREGARIEQFKFSDNVTWGLSDIQSIAINRGTAGNDTLTGYNDGPNQMEGLAGNDMLTGASKNDTLSGGDGNDTLSGGDGNDKLYGGAGNDTMQGDAGDDLIVGGTGNDYFQGNYYGYNYGNDTYQLSKGDGIDTINDTDTTVGNVDTVQFMDVASTELTGIYNSGGNLVITYGSSDQITILNYFGRAATQIEQFKFSDNVTWFEANIKAKVIFQGTAGNDTLDGASDNDTLFGMGGNDTLTGKDGNDKIYGGAGDDTIYGDAGNDLIVGGAGNDNFQNNSVGYAYGNDTYQFSKGDGNDFVNDYDTTVGNVDTVQFMDVASTEITGIYNAGGNLAITYGLSDKVTINNYFIREGARIEQFKFSDDVTWSFVDIQLMAINRGTDGNDNLTGYNDGPNQMEGLSGNDILTGASKNDILSGGDGNDTLSGADGNDKLYGGAGDDNMYGDTGDDLMVGGIGNDNFKNNYSGYSYGNDTYQFSKGDGSDTINDYDPTVGNMDTIQFMDVASTELTGIYNSGGNLVITYGSSDQVTINGYFNQASTQIEQFKFKDGVTWSLADIQSMAINRGTDGNDTLTGYNDGPNQMEGLAGNDNLIGGSKNDTLSGGDGNDTLSGKEGNDRLYGRDGDDTIYGDAGDDIMVGGTGNDNFKNSYSGYSYGNDTYQFSKGDGIDIINDYDPTVGNIDTIQFMDVTSTELMGVYNSGGNLVIAYGLSDQVTINSYFGQTSTKTEQFKFSDGITWGLADIQLIAINKGTTGNDTLTGYNDGPNQMEGLAGNDILNGASKNDSLNGGEGNDTLSGGDSNDKLYGGTGDDIIYGDVGEDLMVGGTGNDNFKNSYSGYSYGNDTYQFSKGDGIDIVNDYDPTEGNIDTVQLMDMASTELTGIYNSGGNLVVTYGSSDQVTINSYFNQASAQIEQFKFSDGVTWSVADIKTKAVFKGTSGNDTLAGTAGNDTFDGGAGTDTLRGGAGNDTYKFGLGYGSDTIQDNDTTIGNVDVLQFLSGTTIDQLWFKQTGNHLEVSLIGTTDKAVIADWYLGTQYHVEEFKTSDGKILLDTQVQNLVNAMAGFAPPAAGQTTIPASYESTLMPVITANWH